MTERSGIALMLSLRGMVHFSDEKWQGRKLAQESSTFFMTPQCLNAFATSSEQKKVLSSSMISSAFLGRIVALRLSCYKLKEYFLPRASLMNSSNDSRCSSYLSKSR